MINSIAIPALSSDRHHPHIRRIAIFQVISGGLSLVLGIIGVIWYSIYDLQVGSGIWAGLFVIATGILGYISVNKSASRSSGITNMANLLMNMNILCAVVSAGAIFCTSSSAGDAYYWIDQDCEDDWHWNKDYCYEHQSARASWGTSLTLAINLSAALVASIISSALSCVCCQRTVHSSVAPTQYFQQPQLIPQEQQRMIQQQPLMMQQPMMQPQAMILQHPLMQQQFLLQISPLQLLPQQQYLQQQQQQQQQPQHQQQPQYQQQKPQQQQQKPQQQQQEDLQLREEIQQQFVAIEQINQELPKSGAANLPGYSP